MKTIALTFDLDFTDYLGGGSMDEMELSFYEIQKVLSKCPNLKTTWYIRLDSQIESMYGTGNYFFIKHKDKLKWLTDNGHEIAWHHHSYKQIGKKWVQDVCEELILNDLEKYGTIALEMGMRSCRMGWGYQTNKTIKKLSDLGFNSDSSAIPRPKYEWEMSQKDWSITKQDPYNPWIKDYRVEGEPALKILEIPINTIVMPVETDQQPGVIRYINPAYKHFAFKAAVESFLKANRTLVLVCHPYEILPNSHKHSLLSFSVEEFERNLVFLERSVSIQVIFNQCVSSSI